MPSAEEQLRFLLRYSRIRVLVRTDLGELCSWGPDFRNYPLADNPLVPFQVQVAHIIN